MASCDSITLADDLETLIRCGLRIGHNDLCTDGKIKWEYRQMVGKEFMIWQEQQRQAKATVTLLEKIEPTHRASATITEAQHKRLDQLANACKAVMREIRKLKGELGESGIKFPDSLPLLLDRVDMDVDAVFVILNTPHLKKDA